MYRSRYGYPLCMLLLGTCLGDYVTVSAQGLL